MPPETQAAAAQVAAQVAVQTATPAATATPATSATPATPAAVDVDAKIAAALQAQAATFKDAWKKATGFDSPEALAESKLREDGKLQELLTAKEQRIALLENTAIKSSLIAALSNTHDPELIADSFVHKTKLIDGKVMVDGVELKTFVADFEKNKPHLIKASHNQGGGAQHSTGQSTSKTMSRSDFDKLPAAEQMAFFKSNGKVTE